MSSLVNICIEGVQTGTVVNSGRIASEGDGKGDTL